MLVINRFRVVAAEVPQFLLDARRAQELLAERPGFLDATLARNLDDPTMWSLVTHWQSVGSYRRALSSYDVKAEAVPFLSRAIDEPSAYEIARLGTELNIPMSRSLG
ncbi:MAG: antibiotic biosynthesis monooxygenase family protein [Nocardioides sp.]